METNIMRAQLRVEYISTVSSGHVPSSSMQVQSSDTIHSKLVDGAISKISFSLPTEVMRVTSLQRNQTDQISLLQTELQQLEEQKREASTRALDVKEEIEHVRRQTFFMEEDNAKTSKHCFQLKREIVALAKENDEKARTLAVQRLEVAATEHKLKRYKQKLEDYMDSVASADTCTSILAEIKQAEERLSALKEKRDYIHQNPEEADGVCLGSVEEELKAKIGELNTQSDQLTEDVRLLQEKVDSARSKQEHVKQMTTVLKKRNAAKVIRLKRQVKQQESRHRQWLEQSRLLQQQLNSLQQSLKS